MRMGGFCAAIMGQGRPRVATHLSFIKKHHKPGGLRPDLFADLNPIRGGREKALEAEKKLAEELRAQGHAVHYN